MAMTMYQLAFGSEYAYPIRYGIWIPGLYADPAAAVAAAVATRAAVGGASEIQIYTVTQRYPTRMRKRGEGVFYDRVSEPSMRGLRATEDRADAPYPPDPDEPYKSPSQSDVGPTPAILSERQYAAMLKATTDVSPAEDTADEHNSFWGPFEEDFWPCVKEGDPFNPPGLDSYIHRRAVAGGNNSVPQMPPYFFLPGMDTFTGQFQMPGGPVPALTVFRHQDGSARPVNLYQLDPDGNATIGHPYYDTFAAPCEWHEGGVVITPITRFEERYEVTVSHWHNSAGRTFEGSADVAWGATDDPERQRALYDELLGGFAGWEIVSLEYQRVVTPLLDYYWADPHDTSWLPYAAILDPYAPFFEPVPGAPGRARYFVPNQSIWYAYLLLEIRQRWVLQRPDGTIAEKLSAPLPALGSLQLGTPPARFTVPAKPDPPATLVSPPVNVYMGATAPAVSHALAEGQGGAGTAFAGQTAWGRGDVASATLVLADPFSAPVLVQAPAGSVVIGYDNDGGPVYATINNLFYWPFGLDTAPPGQIGFLYHTDPAASDDTGGGRVTPNPPAGEIYPLYETEQTVTQ